MFGDGGGNQVGANVVLTANVDQYNQAMQSASQQTSGLNTAINSLHQSISHGVGNVKRQAFGIAASDVAALTAGAAAAARLQDQMRNLTAQNNVLAQSYANGSQRMRDYQTGVNNLRSSFGDATGAAAQLIQTISGFERNGSTQGLNQLATTFEKMSSATGENASALAQSVLSLGQAMGTTLAQAKPYADQLVTMADVSNTTAESLANFASTLGPLGRQLNMTQTQVTGFAAAFSKAGQDGYRASNVFSQMTSQIAQAVQTNSPVLQQYANLLGVTVQAFKGLSGANQVSGVFDAIGRQGSNSLQTLNALGFDGLSTIRTISAVTQQSGGVRNMIRQASGAYGNNATGAGQMTATDQLKAIGQTMSQVGESVGTGVLPMFQALLGVIQKLSDGLRNFMNGPGGALVTTLASVVAGFASLASTLLSVSGPMLTLVTTMGILRSGIVSGFMSGLRGGGRVVAGGNPDELGLVGSNAIALADHGRPWSIRHFNLGQRFGSGARSGLGWAAAMDDTEGAVGMGSVFGMTGRAGYRTARGVGRLGWKYMYGPALESALHQSADRRPWLDTMPGGSLVKGGLGALGIGAGGTAGASAATAAEQTAQEAAAAETVTLRQRFSTLGQSVAGMGASFAGWVSSLKAGSTAQEMDTAATKAATEGISLFQKTLAADVARVNSSLNSLSEAALKGAATTSDLSKAQMGGMGASLLGGRAGGALAGEEAAGGLSGLLGGAMDLITGPIGLAAMIGIPLITSLFGGGGSGSKPSTAVSGTGLSFSLTGVTDPLAAQSHVFNPNRPSGVDYYSASQNSDFANSGVQNIKTAQQAAALYGPYWNQMTLEQQQSLATDLMNPKSLGGNYFKFLGLMRTGRYSSVNANSIAAMGNVPGGLANMYNLAAQRNFANLQDPTGRNLQAAARIFLSGNTAGQGSGFGTPQGNLFSFHPFGIGGDESAQNALVRTTTAHNVMGFGFGSTNNLTQQGSALATALGLTTAGSQKSLANILVNLPHGSQSAQMQYILKHLSGTDLDSALGAAGLGSQITGNRNADLTAALKDFNAHSSAQLVSAFKGFGKDVERNAAAIDAQNENNPLYGAHLLAGASQGRLASLYASGVDQNTVLSALQYKQQQEALRAPYMTTQMGIFGSNTGRGPLGINSTLNPDNLLAQYQGALQIQTREGGPNGSQWQGDTQGQQLLDSTFSALQTSVTNAITSIKQYDMTLDQINFSQQQFAQSQGWQKQAEGIQVGRSRLQEAISVGREEYQFQLTRSRGEHDFQLQRSRAESDYHLQRSRALADFSHQTSMMIKQSALSMMNIYSQNPVQGLTSAQFLLYNNANQTSLLNRQEGQLSTLRGMGLSTNTIQQLGLTDANNNQELNSLFQQIQQNPALIDQLNSAVQQRLKAAGALATDSSSMTYQEQEYQFNLSLHRSAQDFGTQMKRSQVDFDTSMGRSAADFRYQMTNQAADFNRQLTYQAEDFNLQMEHSATQFSQSIREQEAQMKLAATPLSDIASYLRQAAAQKGPMGDLARSLENAARSTPAIAKMLGMLSHTVKPPKGSLWDELFSKAPKGGLNLGLLSTLGATSGGFGGGIATGPTGPLPPEVSARMRNMSPTSGMCLSDVETAWGSRHEGATALAQWFAERGHRHPMSGNMPVGVPIWFGAQYARGQGHVALNAGGGMMWSEDADNKWELKPIWPGALGWTDDIAGTPTALPLTPGFAKGSWELPKDMIAQIHKGEMIIPAKIAAAVRSAVSKGAVQNLHTTSNPVHIGAIHNNTTHHTDASMNFNGDICLEANDPAQMAKDLKRQARIKALAKR